ncbi:hypothetical protein OAG76_01325 [Rubripirellula sp.]|nr:hypothetical protein [Rubripirellula sp.]MDB4634023.1 hypothetical protein [Rubripirellula sp.]
MRAGIADSDSTVGPRMVPISITVSALVAIYILVAIVLIPPNATRHFNFVDERGAITALSAIFLAMGCGFGFASFLLSVGSPRSVRCFWSLVSVALGFLVLDELLEFHERIGDRLDGIDLLGLTSSGTIRGWNDAIVILYGVIAVPVGVMLLPTMVRYQTFLKLICIAFVSYVLHTTIDSVVEPPTILSVILEESAKLYCSLFVALACLAGLLVHAGGKLSSDVQDGA